MDRVLCEDACFAVVHVEVETRAKERGCIACPLAIVRQADAVLSD